MSISVLFICLGNICRSPMAEAVFRDKVQSAGLTSKISVDSAGTGDWHVGDPPHRGTRSILREKGILAEGLVARQIEAVDLANFDYLVVMDESNQLAVEALAKGNGRHGEILRLLDFADSDVTGGARDVPDPYFTGGFDTVYAMVDSGCQGLLAYVVERHGWGGMV